MSRVPRPVLVIACVVALVLAAVSPALAQDPGEGRPVEDELFGLRSVVPAGWTSLGQGIHARGTPPQDPALIALQSAPVPADTLWPALLPQLALSEVPEPTGERATEVLDWTLYAFDVNLPGVPLAVELALSEEAGTTYLVLLQASREEYAALRESAFLPAVDAFAPLGPAPTPDPSGLPYGVEEVSFPGGSEGVTLAGTLTLPPGDGPHPGIVLLSGSGPQDRDESLAPITALKPFAVIADALTRAGIAVLRYDDRGVGESTGDYQAATVEELTDDARAALDHAVAHERIDPGRVGLLGHSEGAIYAAAIAAEDPRVAFVVGMAPPAVDGVSLLIDQYAAVAAAGGAPPEQVAEQRDLAERLFRAAVEGDQAGVEQAIRAFAGAMWDAESSEVQGAVGPREDYVELQVRTQAPLYTSDWFRSLLASDPARDWERVGVPALGIFGALDTQVPAEQNEAAMRGALEAAGNEDATTIVLPDANHLFQQAGTGSPAEYGVLEPEFTPEFLPALAEWLVERTGASPSAPTGGD
jgi:uncharacterized protein